MSTRFGYTLMTEQSGPRDLVRYAVAAERFASLGDHLIAVEPKADLVSGWNGVDGATPIAARVPAP